MGAYIASKSAVIRLTESMAAELREKNAQLQQANQDTAARLAELEAAKTQGGGMDDNGPGPAAGGSV